MNKTSPLPERFYLGGDFSPACFLFLRVITLTYSGRMRCWVTVGSKIVGKTLGRTKETTLTYSGRMSMIAARLVLGSASQLLHGA
ncbi:hypothetical protein PIB30_017787 [Stylosanthes scabra]|uniref:Uncharacterized protein n=1 Tax=Stylosanthes scabra TaxID=79078 RepID=A0ABU6UAD3_9FABA|nr:hypothetical protein [Stylosanthes scabra]